MCRSEEAPPKKSHRGVPGGGASLSLPALPEQRPAAADGLRVSLRLPAGDVRTSLREWSCDRRTTRYTDRLRNNGLV